VGGKIQPKEIMKKKVRTRIAPSPTGMPHIGTIYQALINRAFAKKHNGEFIVRIEDTDRKRLVKGAEEALYKALDWFGTTEDESPRKPGQFGPYRQSERLGLYKKYAEKLVEKGHAYYCFCSKDRLEKIRKECHEKGTPSKYDKCCCALDKKETEEKIKKGKAYVIRLKVPEGETIIVNDLLRGEVKFDSNIVDDQVLLKSDGFPTYHLAVVVDDYLMEITHMVRGEEWLSSAPKHVLLYQYFGWETPVFIHTPVLRAKDKTKLSKRKGHTNVDWYKKQGFLPEAILNFLALLGWSHPKEKEIFSQEEFTKHFDLKDLSPIGPVFDEEKLKWINGMYIREKPKEELFALIKTYCKTYAKDEDVKKSLEDKKMWDKIIPILAPRINTLSEVEGLVDFFVKEPSFKKEEVEGECIALELERAKKALEALPKWEKDEIYQKMKKICESVKCEKKQFFVALYQAVEGKKAGLPVFESMEILGREKTLKRLEKAIRLLK
jgi:glutamyl-tRNA synthetase